MQESSKTRGDRDRGAHLKKQAGVSRWERKAGCLPGTMLERCHVMRNACILTAVVESVKTRCDQIRARMYSSVKQSIQTAAAACKIFESCR